MNTQKKLMALITCGVICGTTCYVKPSSSSFNSLPEVTLKQIEKLSNDEILTGSQMKEGYTWQDGPFEYNGRKYYIVYTQTDCYGIGTIDCNFNLSADIVYEK